MTLGERAEVNDQIMRLEREIAGLRREVEHQREIAALACEQAQRIAGREARLREAMAEFVAWATPETGGMGAGLHGEMFPFLVPSAKKRMLEIASAALAEEVQHG